MSPWARDALEDLNGGIIHRPDRKKDWPDRNRLAQTQYSTDLNLIEQVFAKLKIPFAAKARDALRLL